MLSLMHAVISVECMPEACVLVKGKPRTRGLPAATPVPADKAQIAAQEEVAAVGGAEEAAADLFKPKVCTCTKFELCYLLDRDERALTEASASNAVQKATAHLERESHDRRQLQRKQQRQRLQCSRREPQRQRLPLLQRRRTMQMMRTLLS